MNKAFANNLLRQRESLGLSAEEFARSVGASPEEYTSWERGDVLPPLDTAKRIAEKCGITIDEMMQGEPYQPKFRFGSEDSESASEKEREWAAYEETSDRRYAAGRRIMIAIIVTEVIALVISFFFQSLLASVLQIVILVFLWRGKTWARYVFTIICLLSGIVNFLSLFRFLDVPFMLIFAIVITVYQLGVGAMMIWNRSLEEFLSEQRDLY